jgi:aminoglycoside phosphotransferase (APT) family kinase protein
VNNKQIKYIFKENKLEPIKEIKKIEIGFTNKVYSINEKYILKVCEDITNENNFEWEVYFYKSFKTKIPVPEVIIYDKTKRIYNKNYMIYKKIQGDNLYFKWHLMNNFERKKIIQQLCEILKKINKFQIKESINWKTKIENDIHKSITEITNKKILNNKEIWSINQFIEKNINVLNEQKIALVYWDAHFDNIIVNKNKIVGILDFERTELASIDLVLDIIQRMIEYPKKYMSKYTEKYAKKEDYSQLMVWFKEFYPELFKFKNMNIRLKLYAIKHDLDTLVWYPKSKETKEMIRKTIK